MTRVPLARTWAGAAVAALVAACTPVPATGPLSPVPDGGDVTRGAQVFWAGGCAACHASPGSPADAVPRLGGGRELNSRFGTFRMPNISPDRVHGIGAWTYRQFVDAMRRGVSPSGQHYYPAFPYTSYARMRPGDLADLWSYLKSLPPVARPDRPHALRFPYSQRRLLGPWKRRYLRPGPVMTVPGGAVVARGRYLVEGAGHCGACHTPRDAMGGPDYDRWLAGSDTAGGYGAPNITPANAFLAESGTAEIAAALLPARTHRQSGRYGSAMQAVRRDLAHLPAADRLAIAAYLKAIPAVPDRQ